MDGWESRRKREPGHDHCIVALFRPGVIHGIVIDTRHFTGNYPPAASIDGCYSADSAPDEKTTWDEIVPSRALEGDKLDSIDIKNESIFTHLRLNIYPDGGIARLRVYGVPERDWEDKTDQIVDLASALNGGRALICNNQHFGSMNNLLSPGRGINMGDGWETRRRREPGYDWVIIALGHEGIIKPIEKTPRTLREIFRISAVFLLHISKTSMSQILLIKVYSGKIYCLFNI